MKDYLVITALGSDRPGVVNDLSEIIAQSGCSIDDSRMMILGGEFAIILMISGASEKIEHLLQQQAQLESKTGLTVISKKTRARSSSGAMRDYHAEIVAMDEPGIVHHVTEFFYARNINIHSLNTESFSAPHTGTAMFAMEMELEIPANVSINELKQAFNILCEHYNFDGSLSAAKK
jgi:glycine cleavage system transcriptional repressor